MRADDRALVDAARSVADGAPVDWASAESHADAASRRLVRHLRLVESIASLHRSIPVAEPEPEVSRWTIGADTSPGSSHAGPQWGRLTLLDRIGQGTSCEVYRAWDTALHREVALKLLHEDGQTDAHGRVVGEAHGRVLEEARRLARVRHANVVQVYGAEQHDNRVGLWMELVRGESLEESVQSRGTFGAREAALIGLDLCAALAAVHGAGLLHRDVKAQNVMREAGGRLVLMDFGTGEELAGTNRLVGTPLYLAPEIFRGQRASVQSDLYSLGVLLFYLATAKFPVNAGSMEQLARAHSRRERQPLRDLRPDLPEAFVATVERALDSDPARRYPSVGEFESSLREALDSAPSRAASQPAVSRRRHLGFAFMAAAAVLAALVVALIVWSGVWSGRFWQRDAAIESLAVLPLVDRSGGLPADTGDAITAQLIATLGQIQSLRTIALGSTLPFKESARSRSEIAQQLGVDAVLEGTLSAGTAGAGGLRFNARLIAAGHDAVLWSGVFERPRGELAALLADTANALAGAVRAPVTGAESSRLRQVRSTSPAAEEAYLQGRLHLAGYGAEPAKRALEAFNRAVQFDAGYGAAHAGAALAYVRLGDAGLLSLPDARLSAVAYIRRAFEAGDDSAEVHAALAETMFLYDWDWDGAEREYRRSLDVNPGFVYGRAVYAQLLAVRRRFDDAMMISEETMRLDPQSGQALLNHGLLLYYKKDFVGAQQVADRCISQEPGNVGAHVLAARVAEAQRRPQESLALVTRALSLAGTAAPNLRVMLVRAQAMAGHTDDAATGASELEAAAAAGTIRFRHRDRAYMELGLGRVDRALQAFAAALDERDPALMWINVDPRVDHLRRHPRFQVITKALNLD